MKPIKKIVYGGMILGLSLMLLGGCGSKDKPKETTASSAQTETSSKEENKDGVENHHLTLAEPFKKDVPQYVCYGDDSNRRVQAVIIPYSNSKDEVKVTEYDNGKAEKSYIVPYKVKKITDGDKKHLAIYQYSFYDKEKENWRNFDATWGAFKDLPNQHFITLMELNRTDKPCDAKNESEEQLRNDFSTGKCVTLYDNPDVVSMK